MQTDGLQTFKYYVFPIANELTETKTNDLIEFISLGEVICISFRKKL